jgi:hypothetical protein
MQDPDDLPGLAHFTEHMLFYASGKYPEESAYNKWIEDHGGHTNAWTAAEHTNYQFTVNWDHLETSLDRFAQVSHLARSSSARHIGSASDIMHWAQSFTPFTSHNYAKYAKKT